MLCNPFPVYHIEVSINTRLKIDHTLVSTLLTSSLPSIQLSNIVLNSRKLCFKTLFTPGFPNRIQLGEMRHALTQASSSQTIPSPFT